MAKTYDEESKQTNKVQWFFFVIFIPALFAIALTWIVMTIAGINVGDWASKHAADVPVISSVFPTDDEKEQEELIGQLQHTLDEKEAKIQQLEQEKAGLNANIDELEHQVGDLEAKLTKAEDTDEEQEAQVKQISSSFREVDPEQAAAIIKNLDQPVAVTVLVNLSANERGAILGEMEPKDAAKLTSLLLTNGN
ncbi:MotE family protein [Thalassobacillus sp. B23F22_16]|uniref:MotE family protein n=1 Tax=Thalassobacillus sp. B23F22_16 TaxID=3459513 RepID=UPI00373E38DC